MKLDPALVTRLAAIASEEGLELLAAEVVGNGPRTVLRLVVDGPQGVSLDDCASVSRQASALLDVEDPIRHRYTLEVTSPGLERKLYSPADYERFTGRTIRVKMRPGYREHRVVSGELIALEGGTLRVGTAPEGVVELPLAEVGEARLEVDWRSILKKGKCRP